MKLNASSRARLYALTCICMVIWLVQSVQEYEADGTLVSWPSIIFLACIGIVAAYCGVNAVRGWNAKEPDDNNESES